MSWVPAASLCACHAEEKRCCCPVTPVGQTPSGRISSSSFPGSGARGAAWPVPLLGLRRRLLLPLGLGLLRLRRALLAGFVLAAAPAAPMPLRLSLAVGRGGPKLRLGLRRFCCHACTSWHIASWCFVFIDSAFFLRGAEFPLPAARPDLDRERDGWRSTSFRSTGKLPLSDARTQSTTIPWNLRSFKSECALFAKHPATFSQAKPHSSNAGPGY